MLYGFLILLGLLVLFHRPLFFHGTRYFILRAAKQQHLDLDYKMTGSIFTTLSVSDLEATPTEQGPIQRLQIGTINLRYSLIDLVRKGLPAFLKELDAREVFVELTPAEPLPPEKEQKPQAFKFPALFPETLDLANVNVLIHGQTGNTVLEGLYFSLLPDKAGVLKIQTLDIPGVRRWTDIAAATTYKDRNLVLSDLFIGREIELREFNLDMTELEKNELGVALRGTFFDAPVRLTLGVTDLNATNQLKLVASVSKLNFDSVWEYLNMPPPFHGSLEQLNVTFGGSPEKPKEWTGNVKAGLAGLEADKKRIGTASLTATFADGNVVIDLHNEFDERNTVTLSATADLPEKTDGFAKTNASGHLELLVPEAERLTFFMPEVIIGDLTAKMDFTLTGGKFQAKTKIDSTELSAAQVELTQTHLTIDLEKDLTLPAGAPVFEGSKTRLEGGAARVRSSGYEAEALKLLLSSAGADVKLDGLSLAKMTNAVQVAGTYVLPADMKSWDAQPADASVAVEAPDLSAFVAPDAGPSLKGALKVDGKASLRDKKLAGSFLTEGGMIDFNGLPVRSLKIRTEIADNRATIPELDVTLDDANHIKGGGDVRFGEALVYTGNLDVQLKNLGVFRPLMPPDAPELGGALTMLWWGSGDSRTPVHNGTASVQLTNGRVGESRDLAANFNASYSGEYINIPDFAVSAGKLGSAVFSLFWKDNRLRLTNLSAMQEKTVLLTGEVEAPLHLDKASNLNELLPSSEPLSVALKSSDIDLATLLRNFGQKDPQISGRINLKLDANGTLDDLQAQAVIKGSSIQSSAAENVAPADVSVDLNLGLDDRLRIDGTVRQNLIQPLRVVGVLPCDLAAIKARQAFDPQTPVDLTITLPRSSLDVVSTLVPAIRASRGTAEANVNVRGTIAQPNLSGSITADLSALRFTDPSLPPVNAFGLRLDFAGNRVTVSRCRGVVAGGNFATSGDITFERLDNPVFNLTVGTRNALVLQNDDMTARVSSDLRVTGPLSAGQVQGTVWVTRSRFFKNIDILPIGLPGRPAPQPPPEPTVVSFRQPPLRDWRFDVAIKTLDPFLVQSNLANGRITMDLHFGGTGLEPWLDGTVNIEQLTASLPFSRLIIRDGQVYFTRQQPFVPQLNIRGTSTIRDYNVAVFISGAVTEPEAVFTSDPPLPQAEIVSLIATGMTTTELTRDPNALAGRAAILLFQRTYNSIFRRNKPPPENETFLSRIRFDIGVTDPKTGRQSTTLGIPLSENVVLMGGLDVGGNFQGQVKYLIRFK